MGSSLGVLLQLLGSGMRAGSQLGLHGALGCGLIPRGSRLPCALLSAIPQGRCGIRPSLGHDWVGHLDPSPPAVTAPSPAKQRGSQEQLGAVENFLLCSWGSGSQGGLLELITATGSFSLAILCPERRWLGQSVCLSGQKAPL